MANNKIKVLHYSTHNEDCGIGKYNEQFLTAMTETSDDVIENEFFSYSPNVTKLMAYDQFTNVLNELKEQLKDFDILHIQHEISFYYHDELGRIVDLAHSIGKKVVFTVHTAPDAQYKKPTLHGYGPRSVIKLVREAQAARRFTNTHIAPVRKADLVLVHNSNIMNNLAKHGVNIDKIKTVPLPVPNATFSKPSTEIKTALKYKKGDVIMGTVGFVSKTKGVKESVKSLSFLPDNYKLAIIGGVHPNGGGEEYLDEVCDLIIKRGLSERVYITGYVQEDDRLNALVHECDVCLYPYDNKYYKYVSSAALNNSIANYVPAVVYPTVPFIEMNTDATIAICKSANYYELARYIREADFSLLADRSKKYADKYSYTNESLELVGIYRELLGAR